MQEWLFVGGGGTNGRHVVSVGERGRSAPGGRREKVIGGGGGGWLWCWLWWWLWLVVDWC